MSCSLTADEYRRVRAARALVKQPGVARTVKAKAWRTIRRLTRQRANPRRRRNPEGSSHSLWWIVAGGAVAFLLLSRHAASGSVVVASPISGPVPAMPGGASPWSVVPANTPVGLSTWQNPSGLAPTNPLDEAFNALLGPVLLWQAQNPALPTAGMTPTVGIVSHPVAEVTGPLPADYVPLPNTEGFSPEDQARWIN